MYLRALLSLCVLSLLVSLAGAAQNGLSLKDKVKNSIREKEPAWELSGDTEVAPDESSNITVLTWRQSKTSVEAVILTYESKESALKAYRGVERDRIFGGTTMNVSEDTSLTVGDERLVWADAHSPDIKGVTFVRGRTFIHIKTQDLSVAKMFAEVIDTQIPRE